MKHLMIAAALFGTATAVSAQTVPAATIIIVDMDRVLSESAAGKAAALDLKARGDALQASVTSARTQLGTEEQNLGKTQPAQGAAPAVVTAFQAKVRDYQTRAQAKQTELANRERDLQLSRQYIIKQLNDGATPLISAIMRERGASIVLAEGATLQHTAGIDVTADVIARLDKALPRVSTTAPAGAK